MITHFDIRLGPIMIVLFVWLYRAWRALRTLRLAPAIQPTGKKPEGKVSVIIPAKNEEKNIRDVIASAALI